MDISGIGERERQTIDVIYRRLKASFPLAEYVERGNILGIGEPGKHLMCYFSVRGNGLRIKFKNKDAVYLSDGADLSALADDTIALFRTDDFQLKRTRRHSAPKPSAAPYTFDINQTLYSRSNDEFFMMEKLGSELADMKEEVKSRTFDGCSARLRNAFLRRGIVTVGDLCAYTPQEIFATKNFGYKCLLELYRFILLAVGKQADELGLPPKLPPREIVYETAYADYLAHRDAYEEEYGFLSQCILHIADAKLKGREKTVALDRLGVFGKQKTLQEIGSGMGLTRERIRQIYVKFKHKLLSPRLPMGVSEEIREFAQQTAAEPAGGFLAFLFLEGGGMNLAEYTCVRFFRREFHREELSAQIKNAIKEERRTVAAAQKREKFNSEIEELIVYPAQKTPSEAFFESLHTEREVSTEDEELAAFEYEGRPYACESFLERHVLERFLRNGTFREIKTQSLRIPFKQWFYHPDFQCLTHDGTLVLVEVKPLFRMLEYENIEKFRALKAYCEENGFGYLITDDKNHSFEAIDVHNAAFEERIMQELDFRGYVGFPRFHEIYRDTRANIRHFLTLIKSQDLELQTPFSLQRAY